MEKRAEEEEERLAALTGAAPSAPKMDIFRLKG
jgi:hypothetical protein